MKSDVKWPFFRRGQWSEIEAIMGESDEWEKALKEGGWGHKSVCGNEFCFSLEYWRHDVLGHYLILWSDGNVCETFVASDAVDFMTLMKEWVPAMVLGNLDFSWLETLMSRAFEAWHGHSPGRHCSECDSQEAFYEAEREAEKRRQRASLRPPPAEPRSPGPPSAASAS